MNALPSRREFLRWGLGSGMLGAVGCGTILHPERRGQPAGKLDWKIVALDGIGLLFFFVPGVIAFAVDFATGTIYLPADDCVGRLDRNDDRRLATIPLAEDQRSAEGIERALAETTGREVHLREGTYRTRSLEHIDRFWSVQEEFRV